MSQIIQRIAMKAVIFNAKGQVLILREAKTYGDGTQKGRYQLPGGRVEVGERFEEALRREVREETGLGVEILYPIYVGEWHPTINDVQHQIIATYIVCKPKSEGITLSKEHDASLWINPYEQEKYDIVDPEDMVIERFGGWYGKI